MNLEPNRFLKYFTETGAIHISKNAHQISFSDGEIIFEEKALSDGVYLVLQGCVQLNKNVEGKGFVRITTVEAGDYFGEISILDNKSRSAQAKSIGTTQIAKIPCEVILNILKEEPLETTFQIFERVLEHLRATNEKFAEEVLRKEKLHLVGEMAGMIIHDFKNPITAIQLSAEIIGSKHKDPSTHNKCLAIVQQSHRMVTMVQELLDFSRGNLSIETEALSIRTILEKFKELNQDVFQHSQITINLNPCDTLVDVHLHRILRVFQNISMNAIEAMTGNVGKGTLTISAKEVAPYVEIYIEDTGPGIPDSIRETIFEPFVTHGKKTGTGLGMAIVKMIVDAHRGTISFKSENGKGTTFILRLPKANKV
jgi:signal transduction histidine kinase